jgi:hypothetical protein
MTVTLITANHQGRLGVDVHEKLRAGGAALGRG